MNYNKLHLFFTALSVCALLSAQDIDCTGTPNGTSVCLDYTNIDSEFGHLDVYYNSLNDIYGFQLNIASITILAVESNISSTYYTESSGFILGISLNGQPLPAGDGILFSIDFLPNHEVESCLQNILVSGLGGQNFSTNEYCSIIPSAPVDCAGVLSGENWESDCGCVESSDTGDECDDCAGTPYGDALVDDCGVCEGENADIDCMGICAGLSSEDMCGTCDSNYSNDCIQDCLGEWGGEAIEDECGICYGDGYTDECIDSNNCLNMDCSGLCGGSAIHQSYYNDGDGDNLGFDLIGEYCSTSVGEGLVPNNDDIDDNCFTNIHDECNICDGDGYAEDCVNTNNCQNMDCMSECGGILSVDTCGECAGNGWDNCDEDNDGETNYEQYGYGAYNIDVEDIPLDQGGWVYISFKGSFLDSDSLRSEEYYNIERLDPDGWATLHSIAAYGADVYTTEAHTLQDSSDVSIDALTKFRIITVLDEGNFSNYENGEGYSTDDISPAVPQNFRYDFNCGDLQLSWDHDEEEDFGYYSLYRSDSENGEYFPHLYTVDKNIIDEDAVIGHNHYYKIVANDYHSNESDKSQYILGFVESNHYELHYANNLISFPYLPVDNNISIVMSLFGSAFNSSLITEAQAGWYNEDTGQWLGSIQSISPKKGYWVNNTSESDALIDITGCRENPSTATIEYHLHNSANLISYPGYNIVSIEDALPEVLEGNVWGIIGEGVAALYVDNNSLWAGSLSNLQQGKGYWFISSSIDEISFEFNPEDNLSRKEIISQSIEMYPSGYEYNQSSIQSFYFIENINEIADEDWIIAFNDDIVVGARLWNGKFTDIPVMGKDGHEITRGYIEEGSKPHFKILRNGELIDLYGDIPISSNNEIFTIENLYTVAPLPTDYALRKAYPNPFNPTTTISFILPELVQVELDIYTINGQLITTLINHRLDAGHHSVEWDATNNSSGIYFVSMVAGEFTSTQKLILVK